MRIFKCILISIIIIVLTQCLANSQIIYSSKVDSIVNLVSLQSITKYVRELSGDTITNIGDMPYLIYSRYYNDTIPNQKAAQYIYEKFHSYGLQTRYQNSSNITNNVIAKKTGNKYPNRQYIICAHFDNYSTSPNDTIPGADDNASGVAAVLEAARILSNITIDYTVIFIAFDGEENGLRGSRMYADSAYIKGDTIKGVLNLDMIGYDGNNDFKCSISNYNESIFLTNEYLKINQLYNFGLNIVYYVANSDQASFINKGFPSICSIEDKNNFNPYYHTVNDKISSFNLPYFLRLTKAAIATISSWALDKSFRIFHTQVVSGPDTTGKIVTFKLQFPFPVGSGSNAPRLYYRTGTGNFNYLLPLSVINENYNYYIPGNPKGTQVSYYFAAQDISGNNSITLPYGGVGSNPPGTIPPSEYFKYYVWNSFLISSSSTPKQIIDNQTINDTIFVTQTGKVTKMRINLNINHTNDGDLKISILRLFGEKTLSLYNGENGQNYTDTWFDDTASININQGTPPFTGNFKPSGTGYLFNNTNTEGAWILRVYDARLGNTGTLLNWSIKFEYYEPVKIIPNSTELPSSYSLSQNYPNPFNPSTAIRFQLPAVSEVQIKVYDIKGRELQTLVNERLEPGTYETTFDGSGLNSGVYFYRLTADGFSETKRMVLLK